MKIRIRTLGLTTIIIVMVLSINVQPISGSSYSRTINIARIELPEKLVACRDGGFAIASTSFIPDYDFVLIKTDFRGSLDWLHTYGTDSNDYVKALVECSDGGFLLGGKKQQTIPWIVRTDSSGKQLWNQTVDPGQYHSIDVNDLKELPGGEFIVAGDIREESESDYTDAWLAKFDSNGTQLWFRTYANSTQHQICKSLILCDNGDFMLLGDTANSGNDLQDLWMTRTSDTGVVVWRATFNKSGNENFEAAIETTDSGYVITGTHDPNFYIHNRKMFLLKINSSGTILWNYNYTRGVQSTNQESSIYQEYTFGMDVIECEDYGFAVLGSTNSDDNYNQRNIWLVRTDDSGIPLWNETVRRDAVDSPVSIVRRTDFNDFVVLSETRLSVTDSEYDILLTFIDDEPPITPTTTTGSGTANYEWEGVLIAGGIGLAVVVVLLLFDHHRKTSTAELVC